MSSNTGMQSNIPNAPTRARSAHVPPGATALPGVQPAPPFTLEQRDQVLKASTVWLQGDPGARVDAYLAIIDALDNNRQAVALDYQGPLPEVEHIAVTRAGAPLLRAKATTDLYKTGQPQPGVPVDQLLSNLGNERDSLAVKLKTMRTAVDAFEREAIGAAVQSRSASPLEEAAPRLISGRKELDALQARLDRLDRDIATRTSLLVNGLV